MALVPVLIGIVIVFLFNPAEAVSEKRVALVIGNSAYAFDDFLARGPKASST
jgi:hypothetical protein